LNEKILKRSTVRPPSFSRDLVIVVPKQLSKKYAFAHIAKSRDTDAMFDRGGRHIFIIPWRQYSLIGVWHQLYDKKPAEITVNRRELQQFLDEVNHVYDAVSLTLDDISFINTGLILFGTEANQGGKSDHSFGKRSLIIDHRERDNIEGLMTLIGVRATVARRDSEKVLDKIVKRLNKAPRTSQTSSLPIFGGDFDHFDELVRQAGKHLRQTNNLNVERQLIHNYGTAYLEVLKYGLEDPHLIQTIDGSDVIRAEVVHAVREEMAVKLQDVIFRRTELGTGADPGRAAIEISADLMANELGWTRQKKADEITEVVDILAHRGPWRFTS
jgi:glycerol-3-phosphate dehydrogenase